MLASSANGHADSSNRESLPEGFYEIKSAWKSGTAEKLKARLHQDRHSIANEGREVREVNSVNPSFGPPSVSRNLPEAKKASEAYFLPFPLLKLNNKHLRLSVAL